LIAGLPARAALLAGHEGGCSSPSGLCASGGLKIAIPIMVFTNAFIPDLVTEAKAAGATEVFCTTQLTPQILIAAFNTSTKPGRQADIMPPQSGHSQSC
jgi:hypothetical protein